ncbi:CbiX/SirB N-terminal domain-containing protein [Luteolibacter algae]|uniref:CbiX/SirB N-terminal domain-containing protein n=1 Tax=Luteolibacter algae TaxID=454151 RepID=A0ABW5DB02_9BACT
MLFTPKPNSALLIVGHGSTENPDSSTPYFDHAEEIRRRRLFGEVHVCFWKEEPSMREALYMIDAREVYIVPDFISEGYFTQEVIPRELELEGPTTIRDGKTLHYCLPVGVHKSMTELILTRAREVAPQAAPEDTTLIITGHGTGLNQNSTKAIRDQVDLIAASGAGYKMVTDAYMEEQPFIAEWDKLSETQNVVVVPFFISDGLHSFQDIPVLLGIEPEVGPAASQTEVFRQNPHFLRGKTLYYSSAIGTEPLLADVILDQITDFDEKYSPGPVAGANSGFLPSQLKQILRSGVNRIGQIYIYRDLCEFAYALFHVEDEDLATQPAFGGLDHFTDAGKAREISTYSEDGEYRFTKGKTNLRRGWILTLDTEQDLLRALDQFYPACTALFIKHRDGELSVQNLREKLARQTGMYRYAGTISDAGAQELVKQICGPAHQCAKRILWRIDEQTPLEDSEASRFNGIPGDAERGTAIPLLCREACNHFVAECRKAAKAEFDKK